MNKEGSTLERQAVLKTVGGKTSGGSNPSPSAKKEVPLVMLDKLKKPPAWFRIYSKYYRRRPNIIRAMKVRHDFDVKTPEGVMNAKAGDWLLQDVEGNLYSCKHSVFKKGYEEVR